MRHLIIKKPPWQIGGLGLLQNGGVRGMYTGVHSVGNPWLEALCRPELEDTARVQHMGRMYLALALAG